jgi:hypothetical protein
MKKNLHVALIVSAVAIGTLSTPALAISSANYYITSIATPDVATGGITIVGDALFVGVGGFGGATQSIVRIDSGGTTTIADGFNSISGMVYDPINDRLVVGDNGPYLGAFAPGQVTGDSIYEIVDPLNQTGTPLHAVDNNLLNDFDIPGIADITLDPNDPTGQSFFATDSSEDFPLPNGLLLAIDLSSGTPITVLENGLGYAAGVTTSASEIFFGELDATLFTGLITRTPIGGSGTSMVTSGLDGMVDLLMASDGNLLATSSNFFGPSSILRIDPATGNVLEVVADGFDFAGALAEDDGVIYVLEGGGSPPQNQVLVLTPIPEPGTALLVCAGLAALTRVRRQGARMSVR